MTSPITRRVIGQRKAHLHKTLQWIADDNGISRQRVFQILKKANLPTKSERDYRHCLACGANLRLRKAGNKLYCSWRCFRKEHNVIVTCIICGKQFLRAKSQYQRWKQRSIKGWLFCSKKCQGKKLSEYATGRPRKYDYENILELSRLGYSTSNIAKQLDTPYQSMYNIIKR